MIEQYKDNGKDIQEVYEKYTQEMDKPAAVMEKAEELYKFITKRD